MIFHIQNNKSVYILIVFLFGIKKLPVLTLYHDFLKRPVVAQRHEVWL